MCWLDRSLATCFALPVLRLCSGWSDWPVRSLARLPQSGFAYTVHAIVGNLFPQRAHTLTAHKLTHIHTHMLTHRLTQAHGKANARTHTHSNGNSASLPAWLLMIFCSPKSHYRTERPTQQQASQSTGCLTQPTDDGPY